MKPSLLLLSLSFSLTLPALAGAKSLTVADSLSAPWIENERASRDNGFRLAIMPLIGNVGGHPGIGIDVGMALGHVAFGVRQAVGSDICVMCDRPDETEISTSLLIGGRHEFDIGALTLKTGVAFIKRTTEDYHYSVDGEPRAREFEGLGMPFQLDLTLGGRYAGICLSGTLIRDKDGGSGGFTVGVPFGRLRF